jgi:hypothetical protein
MPEHQTRPGAPKADMEAQAGAVAKSSDQRGNGGTRALVGCLPYLRFQKVGQVYRKSATKGFERLSEVLARRAAATALRLLCSLRTVTYPNQGEIGLAPNVLRGRNS